MKKSVKLNSTYCRTDKYTYCIANNYYRVKGGGAPPLKSLSAGGFPASARRSFVPSYSLLFTSSTRYFSITKKTRLLRKKIP